MSSTKLIRNITTPLSDRLSTAETTLTNLNLESVLTDIDTLKAASGKIKIDDPYGFNQNVETLFYHSDFSLLLDNSESTSRAIITLAPTVFKLNRFALDPVGYPYGDLKGAIDLLLRNNAIRRLNLTEDITLTISDAARQNLINQTADAVTVESPSNPYVGLEFEVINHITSTQNILFAGETIIPGSRHAVQWDGVEWVVM